MFGNTLILIRPPFVTINFTVICLSIFLSEILQLFFFNRDVFCCDFFHQVFYSCPNICWVSQVSSLTRSFLKGHVQHYILHSPMLLTLSSSSHQVCGRTKSLMVIPSFNSSCVFNKKQASIFLSFTDTRSSTFYYKNLQEAFKRHAGKEQN